VLTNLVGNAIKFTAQGEVAVHASLESQQGGQATLRFAITDTGIGIPPGQEAQLFSPFVQADVSTTRKYGGSGLGLAICKQLVEMMGGNIGVESRDGSGSTFWFTVVLEQSAADNTKSRRDSKEQVAKATTPTPGPAPGHTPGQAFGQPKGRILVAEDNATNRLVATAQLRKLGYQATAVNNGAEAVEAVQQAHYDLVLMDCQMPVMDGFEANRRIRAIQPDLPIIAVTADAMPDDQDRCRREGMSDYLAKPVNIHLLAEVLAKWLPVSVPV
jgi:CheY-like chemotaxis protein